MRQETAGPCLLIEINVVGGTCRHVSLEQYGALREPIRPRGGHTGCLWRRRCIV